jgi:hypothetical protein
MLKEAKICLGKGDCGRVKLVRLDALPALSSTFDNRVQTQTHCRKKQLWKCAEGFLVLWYIFKYPRPRNYLLAPLQGIGGRRALLRRQAPRPLNTYLHTDSFLIFVFFNSFNDYPSCQQPSVAIHTEAQSWS